MTLNEVESFFQAFNKLKFENRTESHNVEITKDEIDSFFSNIYQKYEGALKTGALFNLFEVLSPEHYEVKNCKILHWILDEKGSHGYGNTFAEKILYIKELSEMINESYQVRTETCPCTMKDRIDIELKGENLLFYIEAKINASEGVEQISRYQTILEQSNAEKKAIFFLTKNRAKPQTQNQKQTNVYAISWLDVKNAIESVIDDRTDFATFFIKQWCKHISTF